MVEMARVIKEKLTKEEKKDKFGDASKVVRQPEVFNPKNQEEEIALWQDWKLGFRSWLFFAQEDFRSDLDGAERAVQPMAFEDMTLEQHTRSEKLHSILIGLLRERPLKILRAIEDGNGLEAWRAEQAVGTENTFEEHCIASGVLVPPAVHQGQDSAGAGAWA